MDSMLGRIVATVLTLMAIGAAVVYIHGGFSWNKNATITSDVTWVVTNARTQFSQNSNGYTNFTNANLTAMTNAGVFPPDMVRNGTLVDAWGNTVTVSSAGNASEGVVAFGGGGSESVEQCSNVVTTLRDYVSLQVGGTSFTQASLPDSVAAGNACANGLGITLTFQ
ncbi:type 4 pilus major pilin [Paraburkholderia sp. BCC1885]|uniref:type 4 pilus major pilin n=1 Tax=Paraburkholderia sp. BCC1885 TaxID=2562669 RepID=UPI00118234B4|nr:type 4 pilus major pilin [Paraburkholderia sp. BCC1885]